MMTILRAAFPWLNEKRLPWMVESEELNLEDAIPRATEAAIEFHDQWYLPVLAPFIPPRLKMSDLSLSARPANRLRLAGLETFGDLETWSVRSLFELRSMGAGSVQEVVTVLFRENFRRFIAIELGDDYPPEARAPEDWVPTVPLHRSIAASHLETLAHWSMAIGEPSKPLISHSPDDKRLPDTVREAASWLHQVNAGEVGAELADIADSLTAALAIFDDRQRVVFSGRMLHDPPRTLDAIGTDLGVTRERVRQIAVRIQTETASWLIGNSELGHSAAGLRYQVNPVTPLTAILDRNPRLSDELPGLGYPLWYILDKIDDGFESDGTWVATRSLQQVAQATVVRFEEYSNAHGAATILDALEAFADWTTMGPDDIAAWLEHVGFSLVQDFVFAPSVQSRPDRVAAYLSMVNAPQSIEIIHGAVCAEKDLRGLRNMLTADRDRFSRTDRSTFGLTEWGLREYTNLRDAIGELVDAGNGAASLDDVIEDLSSAFSVAPSSIAMYAHNWPFEVVAGVVQRATEQRPVTRSRSIAEIRNVYRHDRGVILRLTVTSDHMRGSGSNVSTALVGALGLGRGESRSFDGSHQSIRVQWTGLQPNIGSIRPSLAAVDAQIGDQALILFHDDGSVELKRVVVELDAALSDQLAASLLLDDASAAAVAGRLGIASDSTRADILKTLRARGETDLADLVAESTFSFLDNK